MATIRVDVGTQGSQAFAAFMKMFERYQQAYESMPEAWKKAAQESEEVSSNFAEAASRVRDLADHMNKMLDSIDKLNENSNETSRSWTSMAKSSKEMAVHIKDATTSLLRWAGITGIVGGLVGAGGLFGLDRLAQGVSNTRQAAMGVDAGYGSYNAFNVNYNRLGDSSGFLGRIADAAHDVNQKNALRQLGISNEEISGDAGDLASNTLSKLYDLIQKIPEQMLANQLQARGLDTLVDTPMAIRLKHMSREEMNDLRGGYERDKRTLDLDKETQKEWQEFTTQMKRAKETLANILVKDLVDLEPGLAHLSEALLNLLDVFLKKDGPLSHWIDELDHGIEWLAHNLDSQEIKDDIVHVIDWIGRFSKIMLKIGKAVVQFGEWIGGSSAAAGAEVKQSTITQEQYDQATGQSTLTPSGGIPVATGRNAEPTSGPDNPYKLPGALEKGEHADYIRSEAKRLGIDPGVALAVAKSEGLDNPVGDHGMSFGDYQLYTGGGVGNLYDRTHNDGGVRNYQKNWKSMDTFALEYAKKHGWEDWHGAKRIGVTGFYGIDRNKKIEEQELRHVRPSMSKKIEDQELKSVRSSINKKIEEQELNINKKIEDQELKSVRPGINKKIEEQELKHVRPGMKQKVSINIRSGSNVIDHASAMAAPV